MSRRDEVRERTERWIREAVLDLGLCPFARVPFEAGRVRIVVSLAVDHATWFAIMDDEVELLLGRPAEEIETTLVVLPEAPADFMDFLDLVGLVEEGMARQEGVLQLASFHPSFQFADTPVDDPGNATNRAPFPTLHLLREDSITAAISEHPDPAAIWQRNVRKMHELDPEVREALSRP